MNDEIPCLHLEMKQCDCQEDCPVEVCINRKCFFWGWRDDELQDFMNG